MPKNSPSATAPTIRGLDDALCAQYLLNTVEALRQSVIPELQGGAGARAGECAVIIARVAQRLRTASSAEDGTGTGTGQDWRTLAEQEGAALDAAEADASTLAAFDTSPAPGNARGFDRPRFEQYLQRHPRGGPQTRITEARVLAGGRSKQTILVGQSGARDLPRDLVIRQDWASAVTGTSVVTEYELLRHVAAAGLLAPEPLLLEAQPEALGAPFLLVTRMPGTQQGDIFNPLPSRTLALQLAEQLARLHRLPVRTFLDSGVPVEAFELEQLRGGLAQFEQLHENIGLPSRTIDVALAWLTAHLDRVDGSPALVHNDLGFHNFLIDGERLTAILDWELAHVGNPAADLGYIRSFVEKMLPWPEFIGAYREAGGADISAHTLDFYTLWCGVRLYCLLLQARAGVASGMVRDTEITYATAQFLPQLLHRISRELRAILSATAD